MPDYRRVVTGVSTFLLLLHKFNLLLVKYEGRIQTWVFDHYDASVVQQVTNLFNLIHSVDALLHDTPFDD